MVPVIWKLDFFAFYLEIPIVYSAAPWPETAKKVSVPCFKAIKKKKKSVRPMAFCTGPIPPINFAWSLNTITFKTFNLAEVRSVPLALCEMLIWFVSTLHDVYSEMSELYIVILI